MDLSSYLDISSRWLVESTCVYDAAESMHKAMSHSYEIPLAGSWGDAPFVTSGKGREAFQAAIPLILKTSLESAKAAELALGSNVAADDFGRVKVPLVNGRSIRVGAIISRAGIIAQFELWKVYAYAVGYPYNRKKADKFQFNSKDEIDSLHRIVDRRNVLTHEIEIKNDSTMRELVEYAYLCHFLAKSAASYRKMGA